MTRRKQRNANTTQEMGLHLARIAELIAAMAGTQNEIARTVEHLKRTPSTVVEGPQRDREVAVADVMNLAALASKSTSGQLYAISDILDEMAALMQDAP